MHNSLIVTQAHVSWLFFDWLLTKISLLVKICLRNILEISDRRGKSASSVQPMLNKMPHYSWNVYCLKIFIWIIVWSKSNNPTKCSENVRISNKIKQNRCDSNWQENFPLTMKIAVLSWLHDWITICKPDDDAKCFSSWPVIRGDLFLWENQVVLRARMPVTSYSYIYMRGVFQRSFYSTMTYLMELETGLCQEQRAQKNEPLSLSMIILSVKS